MSDRIVFHPRYGSGKVASSRYKGFFLHVLFDDNIKRWVRSDELSPVENSAAVAPVSPTTLPRLTPYLKNRRLLEAFRMGIVPCDSVDSFMFGRDAEVKALNSWLVDSDQSTLFVVGGYGTGKSHLLQHAYNMALGDGYAVAFVQMDPGETPFYKPKRVYEHLVRNMRFFSRSTGQAGNFRDLIKEILALGAFQNHQFFGHLAGRTHDEELWSWIEARTGWWVRPSSYYYNRIYASLPGLYDYATAANVYCYLLSSLGWAATQVLGLKGLVLIFDEAESIDVSQYGKVQVEKAYHFLKGLVLTAANHRNLMDAEWREDLSRCGKGISVPFLYQQPSGLKLLFAFTSMDWNYVNTWNGWYVRIPELEDVPRLELAPLSYEALAEVFDHIYRLYSQAYGFEPAVPSYRIFNKVNLKIDDSTRFFVKGAVEALDLIRFHNGRSLDEVLL